MSLTIVPISQAEAFEFIERHHRHHHAPRGWKFGCAVADGDCVVGVISVGRPVARGLDDGWTLEATRCCVLEGYPNACSKLYAAAWRAARALGYRKLVTYTLPSEGGASLRAAGFRVVHQTAGGSWDRPIRPRIDRAPTEPKWLWEIA